MTNPPRVKTLTAALLLTACAAPILPTCDPAPPQLQAWVINYGFHTEIAIPATQLNGGLAPLQTMFPTAETISFGFGKADFFTLRNPGILDFAAGIIPGRADIRAIPLSDDPPKLYTSPIIRIPLTPAEWSRLEAFLTAAFVRNPSGTPIPAAGDDGTGGRFFYATARYSLAYTCNAWSVDALNSAGLPVDTGALFAGSAMRQVARVAGACSPH